MSSAVEYELTSPIPTILPDDDFVDCAETSTVPPGHSLSQLAPGQSAMHAPMFAGSAIVHSAQPAWTPVNSAHTPSHEPPTHTIFAPGALPSTPTRFVPVLSTPAPTPFSGNPFSPASVVPVHYNISSHRAPPSDSSGGSRTHGPAKSQRISREHDMEFIPQLSAEQAAPYVPLQALQHVPVMHAAPAQGPTLQALHAISSPLPPSTGSSDRAVSPPDYSRMMDLIKSEGDSTRTCVAAVRIELSDNIKSLSDSVVAINNRVESIEANNTTLVSKFDNLDNRMKILEQRTEHSANVRAASAPAGPRRAIHGTDYIEARADGFGNNCRAVYAQKYIQQVVELYPEMDIEVIESRGAYIRFVVLRFMSIEDRRVFMSAVRDPGTAPPAYLSPTGPLKIRFKAVIPEDIAKQTDMIRTSVYKLHNALEGIVQTNGELLPCYNSRKLMFFDVTIAEYVNEDCTPFAGRDGGHFCILASAFEELKVSKGFVFDINIWIQFMKDRFPSRKCFIQ